MPRADDAARVRGWPCARARTAAIDLGEVKESHGRPVWAILLGGSSMQVHKSTLQRGAAVFALALAGALLTPTMASATPVTDLTCSGGPLPGGIYNNVTITGACLALAGDVHVLGNMTVADNAALVAVFAAANVTVGGNLVVAPGGALFLGCEPEAFTCFDDQSDTEATNDVVGGSLIADGALASVVHHTRINSGVRENGGGGGSNGFVPIPVLQQIGFPVPAYSDYEDNMVSGGLRVTNLQTGWFGVFRNHVNGTVVLDNNVLFDTDANEVADNVINGSLKCSGNDPAIQIGDSGGGPNTVTGRRTGQCVHPIVS